MVAAPTLVIPEQKPIGDGFEAVRQKPDSEEQMHSKLKGGWLNAERGRPMRMGTGAEEEYVTTDLGSAEGAWAMVKTRVAAGAFGRREWNHGYGLDGPQQVAVMKDILASGHS